MTNNIANTTSRINALLEKNQATIEAMDDDTTVKEIQNGCKDINIVDKLLGFTDEKLKSIFSSLKPFEISYFATCMKKEAKYYLNKTTNAGGLGNTILFGDLAGDYYDVERKALSFIK